MNQLGVFGAFLVIGFLSAVFYSPVIKTNAGDTPNLEDFRVALGVDQVISLSLNTNTLDLNTSINSFVSGSVIAGVTTNSVYGYSLGIEDADSDTSMHHEDQTILDVVTSNYQGAKTSSQMDNNTWGFSLDNTSFYKIPDYTTPARLKTTSGIALTTDNTEVYFGAKVGTLVSGTYTDTVLFTAYPNGSDGPTKYMVNPGTDGVMQYFNDNDCYSLAVGDTFIMTDSRDGNKYRIMKMPDNRCWMLDNLRLSTTETLTDEDTDLYTGTSFTIQYADSIEDFSSRTASAGDNYNLAYIDPEKGGFYTFYTASAGDERSSIGSNTSSICPESWRLPYHSGYGGNYDSLYNSFDSPAVSMRTYFPISEGYIQPGGGFNDDSSRYWTDKPEAGNEQAYARLVGYYSSSTYAENRNYGFHIRCVAAGAK